MRAAEGGDIGACSVQMYVVLVVLVRVHRCQVDRKVKVGDGVLLPSADFARTAIFNDSLLDL